MTAASSRPTRQQPLFDIGLAASCICQTIANPYRAPVKVLITYVCRAVYPQVFERFTDEFGEEAS